MHPRRLMRLVRLMIEFVGRDFRSAEDIYGPLGISKSQFYRDKDALEQMGFSFTYHRERGAFAVRDDPGVSVDGINLSEVLSLILAVGRLPESGDFGLTYRAMKGLRKFSVNRPGVAADFVASAIESVSLEICGCEMELLERLVAAVNEKRRVHLTYGRPGGNRTQQLVVDPEILTFRGGVLYLEGYPAGLRASRRWYRVSYIRSLAESPFLSPTVG